MTLKHIIPNGIFDAEEYVDSLWRQGYDSMITSTILSTGDWSVVECLNLGHKFYAVYNPKTLMWAPSDSKATCIRRYKEWAGVE